MPRGVDRATSPRALRREASRVALLQASRALAERGEDPLDPTAVAREAGVSRPLWYRHFPTRAAFAEALLQTVHAAAPPPSVPAARLPVAQAVVEFLARLAAGLDREPALARALIPASHGRGAASLVRARRRATAVAHLADLLPTSLQDRVERAAFLFDAYLGLQLAWAKGQSEGSLEARVRRDMAWAVSGVLRAAP